MSTKISNLGRNSLQGQEKHETASTKKNKPNTNSPSSEVKVQAKIPDKSIVNLQCHVCQKQLKNSQITTKAGNSENINRFQENSKGWSPFNCDLCLLPTCDHCSGPSVIDEVNLKVIKLRSYETVC